MATYTITATDDAATRGAWLQDLFDGTNNSGKNAGLSKVADGDTIKLPAGYSNRVNRIFWHLPKRVGASNYVYIESSNVNNFPGSTRPISKSYATDFAYIESTGGYGCVQWDEGGSWYKFTGICFTHTADTQCLITTGEDTYNGVYYSYADRNHHLYFDRCWIREQNNDTTTPTSHITTCTRGVLLSTCEDVTFKACRLAGFRARRNPSNGPESSQAILWAGYSDTTLVEDCFLESWFTPLFFASGGNPINTATLSSVSWSGTYSTTTLTVTVGGDGTAVTATSGNFTADMDGEYININGSIRIIDYIDSTHITIGPEGVSTGTGKTAIVGTYSGTFTGSATFSDTTNLAVGSMLRMPIASGKVPIGNSVHSNENVDYQVGIVTAIDGSSVSFRGYGSYDSLRTGNPILAAPTNGMTVGWNGRNNNGITINRCQFYIEPTAAETYWQESGGDATDLPRVSQSNLGNAPKGFIEIKSGSNITVKGCTFDGWYTGIGPLTSRNQGGVGTSGGFPWSGLYNIVFENNVIMDMFNKHRNYSGLIGGPLLEDNEYSSNPAAGPVTIRNLLALSGAEDFLLAVTGGASGAIRISHVTYLGYGDILGGRNCIKVLAKAPDAMILKDSIFPINEYSIINTSQSSDPMPNKVWQKNLYLDNRTADRRSADNGLFSNTYDVTPGNYTLIISSSSSMNSIGFRNPAIYDYRLANNSSYKNLATDGKDIGVDFDELFTAMGENWPFSWGITGSIAIGLDF